MNLFYEIVYFSVLISYASAATLRCSFDSDYPNAYLTATKWSRKQLTFFIENGTPQIAGNGEHQAIRDAFSLWAKKSVLTFTEMDRAQGADIRLKFRFIDGPSKVLAHAYLPEVGIIEIETNEQWTKTVQNVKIDLTTVAAHEIGHAIGLLHSDVKGALMWPYYTTGTSHRYLHSDDIAGVRSLYGTTRAHPHPYDSWRLHASTILNVENANAWDFLVAPLEKGARWGDMFAIKKFNTGTKSTEIHVLDGMNAGNPYKRFKLHTGTALHETRKLFKFVMAPNRDIVAIKQKGGSGTTEVHILSASSNYKKFSLHTRTALHPTDSNWQFLMDNQRNLYCISQRGRTGTEVHMLTKSSNYRKFGAHRPTTLHKTNNIWNFALLDVPTRGCNCEHNILFGVAKRKTGSKKVEVHAMKQKNNFKSFVLQTPTVMGQIPDKKMKYHKFLVPLDVSRCECVWDLYLVKNDPANPNGKVEVHVMDH